MALNKLALELDIKQLLADYGDCLDMVGTVVDVANGAGAESEDELRLARENIHASQQWANAATEQVIKSAMSGDAGVIGLAILALNIVSNVSNIRFQLEAAYAMDEDED